MLSVTVKQEGALCIGQPIKKWQGFPTGWKHAGFDGFCCGFLPSISSLQASQGLHAAARGAAEHARNFATCPAGSTRGGPSAAAPSALAGAAQPQHLHRAGATAGQLARRQLPRCAQEAADTNFQITKQARTTSPNPLLSFSVKQGLGV